MSVIVNKNTTQTPLSAAGKTGSQVIKFIPAPRVYFKAPDSTTSAPVQDYFTKSDGTTPTGWTDLGVVDGMAKVTYTKKIAEIRTGIDEYLRGTYVQRKDAKVEFTLWQFDDENLELLTGYTGSVIQSGSIVNYQVGEEDVIQKALLLVVQDKFTGKEIQYYNPNAFISFSIEDKNDAMVLNVTCDLVSYTPQGETKEAFLSTTIFA